MTQPITSHEGAKYLRTIYPAGEVEVDPKRESIGLQIDVYSVLEAFNVTCPAAAHCIKKLLCAGERGKGDRLTDLIGAEAALSRAIELEKGRQRIPVKEEITNKGITIRDCASEDVEAIGSAWDELIKGNIEANRRREIMETADERCEKTGE